MIKTFLIFILSVIVIIGLAAWIIDWGVHIFMVKGEYKPYDWCDFKTFKKEFDKYKNNPQLHIEKFSDFSIFVKGMNLNYIVYLHANIIKFNDKCMILYPFSWLRYRIWKRNFVKSEISKKHLIDKSLKKESYRQKGLFVK